ncbi:MAG: phosphoadenosine phosphosulfate reductase family protein [Crenarchaeota archaeon]|nr:phosphoadenosine phosphosulfate reductase family protein [Thermoproteota archaeon]
MSCVEGLITILVRAKKDRDVIRHVVEYYYKDWSSMISIETLEGARDPDKVIEKVRELKNRYIIVLLGREECEGVENLVDDRPNVSIVRLRTSKVRNMRPLELFVNIEKGKADMRLRVSWIEKPKLYVLGFSKSFKRSRRLISRLHPLYDVYLCLGRCVNELLNMLNIDFESNCLLIVKRVHDEHDVYVCGRRAFELIIPENDRPYARSVRSIKDRCIIDINESIKLSYVFLKVHEEICKIILRKAFEISNCDKVIVPWSGGKDSTACLLLALKTFGKDIVCPIYVDMGLEYELNRLYVKYVSEILKVDPIVENVDLSDHIDVRGLPTHDSRWCTRLKLKALKRAMSRVSSRPLIVVGDRDTESIYRLKRPFIRVYENVIQVAPLKLWSSIMVQYYLLLNKIPLNPLYMLGFYRLGCFICPAYRYYELDLAEKVLKIDDESTFLDLLREQSYLIY